MLFMVIEHFDQARVKDVYARFQHSGRMAPAGVRYVESWVSADLGRCFQIMECDDIALLQEWVLQWNDLVRFEIVPVSDLYDERESVMRGLGREVDVVQSSFSTPRWGDACQKLRIVNVPFYIDVPRTSPLARKNRITVADLEGMRLRVLRHGNDAMDSLRIDLLADGGVDVIDVDSFDFALFNEAEEKGDAVLTCGAWSGVHPAFVGVPFLCGREVPVFLHYPLEPTLQVQKFVNAMAQLLK